MKLAQIVYEIFESDAERLDDTESQRVHEIDGEIRLIGEGEQSMFISWCSDPVQYAVGIADVSFFERPLQVARDMSHSEFWKGLMGKNIAFNFEDDRHQVLKISSDDDAVYCWTSTFEEEGQDTLFMSKKRP